MFVLSRNFCAMHGVPLSRLRRVIKVTRCNFFNAKMLFDKMFSVDFAMWHATNFKYISSIAARLHSRLERQTLIQNYSRTSIKAEIKRF